MPAEHLDLRPADGGDLATEVDRLVSLGARRLDGRGEAERVVLADPDGTEFCVLGSR